VLAALTLVYGNLAALVQTDITRLLGYSSIGHAGYLLIGIAAGGETGCGAVLYYLCAYGASNLAVFWIVTLAGRELGSDKIEAYRGLARRSPFLAGMLFLALLSLAGVPPTAGFFGKFLILFSAVRSELVPLALLGALGVAVALFYFLSILRAVDFEAPASPEPLLPGCTAKLVLILLAAAILVMGFWQAPFVSWTSAVARAFF
jgi:NADH-quinone oxidoreductase subunit N